jgi:hypothetical protein
MYVFQNVLEAGGIASYFVETKPHQMSKLVLWYGAGEVFQITLIIEQVTRKFPAGVCG